jgi:hypothetical protein
MTPRGILVFGLAGVLGAAGARAQDAGVETLFDFMYAKFAASYATGQGKDAKAEFLVLASPGLALTQAELKDPREIWRMVDKVPRPARLYTPSGDLVSDLYQRILETAQVTGIQDQGLRAKAQEAARLLNDKRRPGKPTEEYSRYLQYEAAWVAAQDALQVALTESQASGRSLAPQARQALEDAVAAAARDWADKGFKARIGGALASIQKLYEANSRAYFYTLGQELGRARFEDTYPVELHPATDQWLAPTGWNPWLFQASDLNQPAPREPVPLAPGAIRDPRARPAWASTLVLRVELKRVRVTRPWLDLSVFRNRSWRMGPGAGFQAVSTGNLADRDQGPLPLVVTGLLLARNLTLTWTGEAAVPGGKLPAQVGPFTVAGPGRSLRTARMERTAAGAVVTAPDPQIIGFFCQIVPKSPDPDPKFFK